MDLMDFIESNWFELCLMSTLIMFSIKFTNKVNIYVKRIEDIDKKIDNKINEIQLSNNESIINLSNRINEESDKRVDGQERTKLIMEGVEATLISLRNQGHNGPVTASIIAINEYKTRKASE